jgi:hypothetical protein
MYISFDQPLLPTGTDSGPARRSPMSDLVAVAYPDSDTVLTRIDRLRPAQTEHLIELEDAVIVERLERRSHDYESCTG